MKSSMTKKHNSEQLKAENPNWTTEEFVRARSASEVLPHIFGEKVAQEMLKPRGRPRAIRPKEHINIRLSQDVVEYFRSSGDGWQTRIDTTLRQYIAEHPNS